MKRAFFKWKDMALLLPSNLAWIQISVKFLFYFIIIGELHLNMIYNNFLFIMNWVIALNDITYGMHLVAITSTNCPGTKWTADRVVPVKAMNIRFDFFGQMATHQLEQARPESRKIPWLFVWEEPQPSWSDPAFASLSFSQVYQKQPLVLHDTQYDLYGLSERWR